MTDDQFWRIAILGGFWGLVAAFKPQISRFFYRIGYRDWRKPDWKPPGIDDKK